MKCGQNMLFSFNLTLIYSRSKINKFTPPEIYWDRLFHSFLPNINSYVIHYLEIFWIILDQNLINITRSVAESSEIKICEFADQLSYLYQIDLITYRL